MPEYSIDICIDCTYYEATLCKLKAVDESNTLSSLNFYITCKYFKYCNRAYNKGRKNV